MGCTSGKFGNSKLSHSESFTENSDMIQTVFQADTTKSEESKSRKSKNPSKRNRRSNRKNIQEVQVEKSNEKLYEFDRRFSRHKPALDKCITGKYSTRGIIAKGSCGYVLRVENRFTRQPYALKVIDTSKDANGFDVELSILRRVNHPNVIRLEETLCKDNKVYMVMQLATGGSLLDRLEVKGSFSESKTRSTIEMVLNGVKYLHSQGIAHRDLKPDNLLYYHPGKDSRLMITDFSLASAKRCHGEEYMYTICGTPHYVAPEIVSRRPYTYAVDLWAVGIILYVTASGTLPFNAQRDSQLYKLILKGHIHFNNPIWKQFSSEVKVLIRQLLQVNPAHRLTASQALQHDWITATRLTYSSASSKNSAEEFQGDSSNSFQSSSISSLRSHNQRLKPHHVEKLSLVPEVITLVKQ